MFCDIADQGLPTLCRDLDARTGDRTSSWASAGGNDENEYSYVHLTHAYSLADDFNFLRSFILNCASTFSAICVLLRPHCYGNFGLPVLNISSVRINSQFKPIREHLKSNLTAKFGGNRTIRSFAVLHTDTYNTHPTFDSSNWTIKTSLRLNNDRSCFWMVLSVCTIVGAYYVHVPLRWWQERLCFQNIPHRRLLESKGCGFSLRYS